MLEIGQLVHNEYEVLNLLGKGGMGTVYLCEHRNSGIYVALKEINKENEHYLVEASILKNLDHTGIPKIIDIYENDNYIYMIEDYIKGETLKNKIENGKLGVSEIELISLDICHILGYLHSLNPPIIYRDLKPSNIMIKPNGEVVLIDFGISREYKPNQLKDTIYMGSLGYAAPEQFGHEQTTNATDIYALGAVMYFMFFGKGPSNIFEPLRDEIYPEKMEYKYKYILRKSMQINPKDRYESIDVLRDDISSSRDFRDEYNRLYHSNSFDNGKTIKLYNTPDNVKETGLKTQIVSNSKISNSNYKQNKYSKRIMNLIALITIIISIVSVALILNLENKKSSVTVSPSITDESVNKTHVQEDLEDKEDYKNKADEATKEKVEIPKDAEKDTTNNDNNTKNNNSSNEKNNSSSKGKAKGKWKNKKN